MQSKVIAISLLIMLSSVGSMAHSKDGMLAFFAKKVGSSVIKIGEQFAKNKLSDKPVKKSKKVDIDTIPESNVIIIEGDK